jgi:hypothetical protein
MKMKELTNTVWLKCTITSYYGTTASIQKYTRLCRYMGYRKIMGYYRQANLNLPIRPGFEYKGFIHWDYDPETKPQNVQGVLALADQDDENMGGFQCIPELYRTYDTWKLTQPDDRDHFKPDVTGFEIVKVKMNAGDLLIFNSTSLMVSVQIKVMIKFAWPNTFL